MLKWFRTFWNKGKLPFPPQSIKDTSRRTPGWRSNKPVRWGAYFKYSHFCRALYKHHASRKEHFIYACLKLRQKRQPLSGQFAISCVEQISQNLFKSDNPIFLDHSDNAFMS